MDKRRLREINFQAPRAAVLKGECFHIASEEMYSAKVSLRSTAY